MSWLLYLRSRWVCWLWLILMVFTILWLTILSFIVFYQLDLVLLCLDRFTVWACRNLYCWRDFSLFLIMCWWLLSLFLFLRHCGCLILFRLWIPCQDLFFICFKVDRNLCGVILIMLLFLLRRSSELCFIGSRKLLLLLLGLLFSNLRVMDGEELADLVSWILRN